MNAYREKLIRAVTEFEAFDALPLAVERELMVALWDEDGYQDRWVSVADTDLDYEEGRKVGGAVITAIRAGFLAVEDENKRLECAASMLLRCERNITEYYRERVITDFEEERHDAVMRHKPWWKSLFWDDLKDRARDAQKELNK